MAPILAKALRFVTYQEKLDSKGEPIPWEEDSGDAPSMIPVLVAVRALWTFLTPNISRQLMLESKAAKLVMSSPTFSFSTCVALSGSNITNEVVQEMCNNVLPTNLRNLYLCSDSITDELANFLITVPHLESVSAAPSDCYGLTPKFYITLMSADHREALLVTTAHQLDSMLEEDVKNFAFFHAFHVRSLRDDLMDLGFLNRLYELLTRPKLFDDLRIYEFLLCLLERMLARNKDVVEAFDEKVLRFIPIVEQFLESVNPNERLFAVQVIDGLVDGSKQMAKQLLEKTSILEVVVQSIILSLNDENEQSIYAALRVLGSFIQFSDDAEKQLVENHNFVESVLHFYLTHETPKIEHVTKAQLLVEVLYNLDNCSLSFKDRIVTSRQKDSQEDVISAVVRHANTNDAFSVKVEAARALCTFSADAITTSENSNEPVSTVRDKESWKSSGFFSHPQIWYLRYALERKHIGALFACIRAFKKETETTAVIPGGLKRGVVVILGKMWDCLEIEHRHGDDDGYDEIYDNNNNSSNAINNNNNSTKEEEEEAEEEKESSQPNLQQQHHQALRRDREIDENEDEKQKEEEEEEEEGKQEAKEEEKKQDEEIQQEQEQEGEKQNEKDKQQEEDNKNNEKEKRKQTSVRDQIREVPDSLDLLNFCYISLPETRGDCTLLLQNVFKQIPPPVPAPLQANQLGLAVVPAPAPDDVSKDDCVPKKRASPKKIKEKKKASPKKIKKKKVATKSTKSSKKKTPTAARKATKKKPAAKKQVKKKKTTKKKSVAKKSTKTTTKKKKKTVEKKKETKKKATVAKSKKKGVTKKKTATKSGDKKKKK